MVKQQIIPLQPVMEREIADALMYRGKIDAIKLYMKYTNCRLRDAKNAVERIGRSIEPNQAND